MDCGKSNDLIQTCLPYRKEHDVPDRRGVRQEDKKCREKIANDCEKNSENSAKRH